MSYSYWIPLHQHTIFSNGLGYFEIVTKPDQYIDYAKQNNLPAVCFTEHGSVTGWIKKKELVEAAGLKFIDGIEAYVAMNLDDKNRGYHTIVIARNYDGVKEINRLSSGSFNRKNGHFYYRPRILFADLAKAVSQGNIFITTACLAGGIAQNLFNQDDDKDVKDARQPVLEQWLQLAIDYPDRVFLEVQPHLDDEQIRLNHALQNYAATYGLKLIAANDIHALDSEHDRLRKIIKRGKRNGYDDDDKFELWCKSRKEMVEAFKEQGVLHDDEIERALDLTVEIAESVEEFEIDKNHKYPRLYADPEGEFKKRIKQGLVNRGIDKLPRAEQIKYINRVNHEYKVYQHNGAIDYMLSHEDILNAAKEHGIHFGFGRGSVSGSLIAYLCGQTEMDSVKLGLNFERFMNPERISLADIDVDAYKPDQQWIQHWILTNPKWHAASIMTANTYGIKAAVKAIADGMDRYAGKPAYIQSIRNQIGDDGYIPESLYEEHQQLIDDAKKVVGVIDSFGRHAAGIVIDTNTLDDHMGTQTISGWDYPVTQVAMKEIDHNNWVKYDLLGLDNVGLISRAAELAGLPYPTPNSDFIDFEDDKVWGSMRSDNIGVFQMEGDRAGKLLANMLSPDTIQKIKGTEVGKKVKYMDLLSLVNAAQRPSGSSYVDAVTHGVFKDNGHPALNEFLAPTLGFLVYQEQLIEFLVRFCGYSAGKADLTRRAIGKKLGDVIEKEVPEIHKAFVQTMVHKYHDTPEHAERVAKDFMQVFMDAANYGFSINHSMAYSYIGYISTWLRYYYPLEWCTAAFEIWRGKQEKILKVTQFAKKHGIKMNPVRFGKSKGLYYMDKDDNAIYEGTAVIKGNNAQNGDSLFEISDQHYGCFTDLLMRIYDPFEIDVDGRIMKSVTFYQSMSDNELKAIDKNLKEKENNCKINFLKPIAINSKSMLSLISLNYFVDFGAPYKLQAVYKKFRAIYKPKNKRYLGKAHRYLECVEYEKGLENKDYPLSLTLQHEFSLLGRCITHKDSIPANFAFVTDLVQRSNRTVLNLYSVKRGISTKAFIRNSDVKNAGLKPGNLIRLKSSLMKPKFVKVGSKWCKSDSERELWVRDFAVIK